jgi:hypothetical protein
MAPVAKRPKPLLGMSYTVGIVGATGAVGKEIRQVLEKRRFPVGKLRIFGSERSAGSKQDTAWGPVTVELFTEAAARECDVVFLAVSGDFARQHARNLADGDGGCVVIDNSVRAITALVVEAFCAQVVPLHFSVIPSVLTPVRISLRTGRTARGAGNQRTGNEEEQIDCQSQLYHGHRSDGSLAATQTVWFEENHHVHLPGRVRCRTTRHG